MNVFVTGATGVIGRALVPQLVAAGHQVSTLSRAARNDELLGRMGARPVTTDLFDVDALTQALVDHEAIFHLATKIPPTMQMGRRRAWLENDRSAMIWPCQIHTAEAGGLVSGTTDASASETIGCLTAAQEILSAEFNPHERYAHTRHNKTRLGVSGCGLQYAHRHYSVGWYRPDRQAKPARRLDLPCS